MVATREGWLADKERGGRRIKDTIRQRRATTPTSQRSASLRVVAKPVPLRRCSSSTYRSAIGTPSSSRLAAILVWPQRGHTGNVLGALKNGNLGVLIFDPSPQYCPSDETSCSASSGVQSESRDGVEKRQRVLDSPPKTFGGSLEHELVGIVWTEHWRSSSGSTSAAVLSGWLPTRGISPRALPYELVVWHTF